MNIFIGNPDSYVDSDALPLAARGLKMSAALAQTTKARGFFHYQRKVAKEAFALAQEELTTLFRQDGFSAKLLLLFDNRFARIKKAGFFGLAAPFTKFYYWFRTLFAQKQKDAAFGAIFNNTFLSVSQTGRHKKVRLKCYPEAVIEFYLGQEGFKIYNCRGSMPQLRTMIETVRQAEKQNPEKFRRAFQPLPTMNAFSR